ncbi:hypothetical protein OWC48_41270 [Bradyrhizobium sp. Arg816]|nr:hypothetical protein [Bradyrhizobium sp. Arg816]MDI3566829.1 hypothetical protein [Bradyrhizobium sp. Arg816]
MTAARRLAIEALGQIIIDDGFKDQYGLKSIRIRDDGGEILRVSATRILQLSGKVQARQAQCGDEARSL